jgi:uncharacterized membrane protein
VGAPAPPPPPPPPQGGYAPPPPPQGSYAPPQSGYAPPQGGYAPQPAASAGGMTDNVAAALCYVVGFITGIIFLVLSPYNSNRVIRFHAFQSIFLNVACVVLMICMSIISTVLFLVMHSFALAGLWGTLATLIYLGVLVLWIVMIVFAYQGKQTVLPIIGPLAQKQAGN